MRRGLASLIIGLSLVVATVSWAGFTLSRTILDPGRSERLAEQLLDNPQVRAALVDRLADAVETQIPPEAPVSRQLIEAGADTALDDPRVRALVVDGFVRFHQSALEGEPEPVVIDAGELGAVSRDALVAVRPDLDPFVPAAPSIELELPTAGFGWLGTIKRIVDRFTLLAALVATAGAALALLVTSDRGSVLRRVAFWGYGAAAFWIVVGLGVPRLAELLSPTSAAIAAAAVDVFLGAMIRPAVILAVASTGLLVLGLVVPTLARKRAALVVQPRRPVPNGAGAAPTAAATAPAAPTGRQTATGSAIGASAGVGPTTIPSRPPPPPGPAPLVMRPDPTMVAPIPTATPPGAPPAGPGGQPHRPGPSPAVASPPAANGLGADDATLARRPADRAPTEGDGDTPAPAWEEGVGYLDDTPSDTTGRAAYPER